MRCQWFVRSEDGEDYAVGKWVDGVWVPGLPQDAVHELLLITSRTASPDPEPLAYIHAKPLSDSQPWETYSR